MLPKVNEQMVLNWLNWDGFQYELGNDGEGGSKVCAKTDVLKNEIRLSGLVEYLNGELQKQFDEYTTESGCLKSRVAFLEGQFRDILARLGGLEGGRRETAKQA